MKKVLETIREMRKNPKGKAILFFGFYLLFFIAVILFVRFSSRNRTLSSDYEKGNSTIGIIGALQNSGFTYQYRITNHDENSVIDGKHYKNTDSFTYQDKSYFCTNGSCFVKGDSWESCLHPFRYYPILDPDTISWILEHSYYESKTSYENGQVVYHYLVSTDTLNQVIFNEVTDLDLENNSLSIRLDEKQRLSVIIYQLDSFCSYHESCEGNLKIEAEYSQIGEITEIENPVMD